MALRGANAHTHAARVLVRPAVRHATVSAHQQHCRELVRKHDYDGYLATLFLPRQHRDAAFALRAFNVELATIRDAVKDDRIGLMRFQFWRQMLQEKDSPPQQPVALALHEAMQQCRLSQAFLGRLIQARQTHISDAAFPSITDLDTYCEHTQGTLLYLLMEACGLRHIDNDHAASHVGKAIGTALLLRATPALAKRGKVRLPLDLLAKHQLSQTAVMRGEAQAAMRDAVHELASQAYVHLETASRCKLPGTARKVLLAGAPTKLYLDKLETVDFDVFAPGLAARGIALPVRMAAAAFRGRIF